MDVLEEAERAAAGDITENAAACMVFLSILGSGRSHEKIKEEVIGSLRQDPNATDVDSLR